METSFTNTTEKPKVNSGAPLTPSTIEGVLGTAVELKDKFRDLAGDQVFERGLAQLKDIGTYLRAHWKTIVPAAVVVGAAGYFIVRKGVSLESIKSNLKKDSDSDKKGMKAPSKESSSKQATTKKAVSAERH